MEGGIMTTTISFDVFRLDVLLCTRSYTYCHLLDAFIAARGPAPPVAAFYRA
jgi:hypothetical protein